VELALLPGKSECIKVREDLREEAQFIEGGKESASFWRRGRGRSSKIWLEGCKRHDARTLKSIAVYG
jgi:hypothetical protein